MEAQIQTRIPSVMEDPGAQSVAKVYAVAYLDAADIFLTAITDHLALLKT